MYLTKARHALSPIAPPVPDHVEAAMWALFVAIGAFWTLGDDPAPYRLRFRAFMANRIDLNPLYHQFYSTSQVFIEQLIAAKGADSAYAQVFTQKSRDLSPKVPYSELEIVQQYVANEFIALRLALGGFRTFGATNYCGYFGGANIAGEPVPYRPMEPKHGS
jgi:hypothetical protein